MSAGAGEAEEVGVIPETWLRMTGISGVEEAGGVFWKGPGFGPVVDLAVVFGFKGAAYADTPRRQSCLDLTQHE